MSRKKPNVVFVLTDDQGYGDLGCHGNPWIKTPELDVFHSLSHRFTQYHVGPTCAPTRAGLLTGHCANSTGVWHTVGGRSLLREDEWSIADAFRGSGYRTGLFGKWHLGDSYPYRPQDRGFEETVTHGGGGLSQVPDYWGNDYFDDTYFVNGEPREFEGYCTDVWFGEAVKFIEKNRDNPFICFITPNAPHEPYNVEDKYADLYRGPLPEKRARFYGMISNIDENFGKLRRKLSELGLEENTILIFMTDNGSSGGMELDADEFVTDGYNAGMRGKKGSAYDGGHRTPFFLRWPAGGIDEGIDIDRPAANVDFMPTLLDLCGVDAKGHTFHGESLVPLLKDPSVEMPDRVIVTDSQRLPKPVKWRLSSVITTRWRLVNGVELYDIKADPEQKNDVAPGNSDVVTELREEYEKWWDKVTVKSDDEIPLHIGGNNGRRVEFNAHDLRHDKTSEFSPEDVEWNFNPPYSQTHIRQGMPYSGYWEVEVEKPGEYEFELRRWPASAGHKILDGIEGSDIEWKKKFIHESDHKYYTGGKALDIEKASLEIAGKTHERPITENTEKIIISLDLPKGATHMKTAFTGRDGTEYPVYYLYITGPNRA